MEFLRLALLLGFVYLATSDNTRLQERFSWKQVDYDFPSENERQEAINSGSYIPENNLPLGLEAWKNKLFVTLPQWKGGTAATVTYIDLDATQEKSPKLKPYPNWDAHKLRQNNGVSKIANVFRLHVDVCDRLWLLDTGLIDILGKREVIHAPKIQAYDLNTDSLVVEYTLPPETRKEGSFLANIIADVRKDNCNKAFVYVPDLGTNALIVYNLATNESWRVNHHFFHFDPVSGDYNIGGINFQWTDGIFGVALSPVKSDGYRTLYFHPMSSTKEFAVSTKIIQNRTIASDMFHEYKLLGSRGPKTQSSSSSLDEKTGVLFYTLLNKDGVGCWNSNNEEYSADTNAVIAFDKITMTFPNDLKVDKNSTLWVLTDRLPNFIFSQLNYSDVNFRIFSAPVKEAIKGTICDKSSSSRLTTMSLIGIVMMSVLNWQFCR